MSGFAPGDVVVCVDADPFPPAIIPPNLTVGQHYRISRAAIDPFDGAPIVQCAGVYTVTRSGWFGAYRFRKIDPATESFTAEIRACRPIKHREPANA